MKWLTSCFVWIETRLDTGGWVRRIYLVVATYMLWRITEWAMAFASNAPVRFTGTDLGVIIGAVSLPASAVAKFAFDTYVESRKK